MAGEIRINYEKSTRDIEDSRYESNIESDDHTVCVWQDDKTICSLGTFARQNKTAGCHGR